MKWLLSYGRFCRTQLFGVFGNAEMQPVKLLQNIKGTIWAWLNMTQTSMKLKEKIKFSDLLFGWRFIMSEQG
ncbi:hypothetical protein FRX31_032457, partial [Thalictrum thalictroides]